MTQGCSMCVFPNATVGVCVCERGDAWPAYQRDLFKGLYCIYLGNYGQFFRHMMIAIKNSIAPPICCQVINSRSPPNFHRAAVQVDIAVMWAYKLHPICTFCWLGWLLTASLLWMLWRYNLAVMSSFCMRFCSSLFLGALKQPNLSSQPRGRYQLCILIIAKKKPKLMCLKDSLVKWQALAYSVSYWNWVMVNFFATVSSPFFLSPLSQLLHTVYSISSFSFRVHSFCLMLSFDWPCMMERLNNC